MRLQYFEYFQGARANCYRKSREVVWATGCISRDHHTVALFNFAVFCSGHPTTY